jgi:hypothetical protein
MRRGLVSIGLLTVGACSRTDLVASGPRGSSAGNGDEGDTGASTGTSTESGGTSDAGVDGGTENDGPAARARCLVSCCDGDDVEMGYDTEAECKSEGGLFCRAKLGPRRISFDGGICWSSEEGCPTMRPCEVNCCGGVVKELPGGHFDGELCADVLRGSSLCDPYGGAAKVFFGGDTVWQNLSCAGSCFTHCCDGVVLFRDEETQTACEISAGSFCGDKGGPRTVGFDSLLVWTSEGQCPSLQPCRLRCADGADTVTGAYEAMVCLAASEGGGFCEAHGGNASVYFDGQQIWP